MCSLLLLLFHVSAGDESGMLEDMYIGILELGSVTFQVWN